MNNNTPARAAVLYEGRDDEYPTCPTCGQIWKVADRAYNPHAFPIDPPGPDRPTYKVTGCSAVITKAPDTGAHHRLMSWPCDGHTMTVARPVVDVGTCLAGSDNTACRGGQPLVGGRWNSVHVCRCCDNRGFHYVRRDGVGAPSCLSNEPTTTSSPLPTKGVIQ